MRNPTRKLPLRDQSGEFDFRLDQTEGRMEKSKLSEAQLFVILRQPMPAYRSRLGRVDCGGA